MLVCISSTEEVPKEGAIVAEGLDVVVTGLDHLSDTKDALKLLQFRIQSSDWVVFNVRQVEEAAGLNSVLSAAERASRRLLRAQRRGARAAREVELSAESLEVDPRWALRNLAVGMRRISRPEIEDGRTLAQMIIQKQHAIQELKNNLGQNKTPGVILVLQMLVELGRNLEGVLEADWKMRLAFQRFDEIAVQLREQASLIRRAGLHILTRPSSTILSVARLLAPRTLEFVQQCRSIPMFDRAELRSLVRTYLHRVQMAKARQLNLEFMNNSKQLLQLSSLDDAREARLRSRPHLTGFPSRVKVALRGISSFREAALMRQQVQMGLNRGWVVHGLDSLLEAERVDTCLVTLFNHAKAACDDSSTICMADHIAKLEVAADELSNAKKGDNYLITSDVSKIYDVVQGIVKASGSSSVPSHDLINLVSRAFSMIGFARDASVAFTD